MHGMDTDVSFIFNGKKCLPKNVIDFTTERCALEIMGDGTDGEESAVGGEGMADKQRLESH